jgi:hypothetical protein
MQQDNAGLLRNSTDYKFSAQPLYEYILKQVFLILLSTWCGWFSIFCEDMEVHFLPLQFIADFVPFM